MKNINHQRKKNQCLQTYKNKPCYNLLLKFPFCNAQIYKSKWKKTQKNKKYKFNQESYEEAKLYINDNDINDKNEQIEVYSELKQRVCIINI